MASGRINRNEFLGLDSQPEGVLAGVDVVRHSVVSTHHCMVYMVFESSSDLDDTELPRLTSDFRLRRSAGGEILIFADLIIPYEWV